MEIITCQLYSYRNENVIKWPRRVTTHYSQLTNLRVAEVALVALRGRGITARETAWLVMFNIPACNNQHEIVNRVISINNMPFKLIEPILNIIK